MTNKGRHPTLGSKTFNLSWAGYKQTIIKDSWVNWEYQQMIQNGFLF